MPKLMQINVTANWGSTGKIAESIGVLAQKRGWKSYIIYGRNSNPSSSNLIKVGNVFNPYLHYGLQRIFDSEGLHSKHATRKLIKRIRQIEPDIIHLHNIHDHWINYPILFEYLNKTAIKVVWTFHDCWAFTGHCFHFVTKQCNKWKTQCHDCPLTHEYPNTIADSSIRNYRIKKNYFTGNQNLTIVACSTWMANLVRESFLGDKKTIVIRNGVDLNVFRPIYRDRGHSCFRILAVSNVWNREKGYEDILKLRELLPPIFEITIVGLSDKQIRLAEHLGIKGIGKLHYVEDLVNLYSEADVLINTSYADTFPTVNLEALACGVPVITYNTGGSPEAIDERTGKVIPQGDINSLAANIKHLYHNPISSLDCRQRANLLFDKNKCFSQYIDLFEMLVAE